MRSVGAELVKLGKRPASLVLLGVWLGQLLTMAPANAIDGPPGGLGVYSAAAAMLFGAFAAGSEYGWGTIRNMLTQRAGRVEFAAVKLAAIAMCTLVVSVIGTAVALGATSMIAAMDGAPAVLPGPATIAGEVGTLWLAFTMWAPFGAMLATLTRNVPLTIALGVLWVIAVVNVPIGVLDGVRSQVMATLTFGLLTAALVRRRDVR